MKKTRNLFFTIFHIVFLFVMGLIVAAIVALSRINLETLRGGIVSVLRDATGRDVEIAGAVSWRFSLRPQIELNDVRIPNAEWATRDYAFSAQRVYVTINLISLFQDRPTIQNIKIYDAVIDVEKNQDGKYSFQTDIPRTNTDDPQPTTTENVTPEKPKYPFVDPGLGGVEIRNLTAYVFDEKYTLAGFEMRYIPKHDGREYSGWIKFTDDVYPFIVSFSEYNAERKVYPMKVAFATGGEALISNIALEGTSLAPIDFVIKGDVPDIATIGRFLNYDMPDFPLLKINIAGGYDWKKLKLRKSSISVNGDEITLSGTFDWRKKPYVINADIESEYISLMHIFPNLYRHKWVRPDRPLNAFQGIPLFGTEFLKFNFNLHLDISDLVVYRELSIRDIDAKIVQNDGNVRIDGNLSMGGGKISVAADGTIAPDGLLSARAGAIGREITVGKILSEIQIDNFISDLNTNFETYLEANGHDLSELMNTITGPVQIYSVGSGYAYSALVKNIYGADFLTNLRHGIEDLFSSEKKHNQIKIECVAINLKLRNGLAETQNGVAVETNAINLRLAGALDLGKETMKLSLTTVPVRGLKLSLTGNVVNSVELIGSLSEPDIKISGAAVAGKVASATGLGLLLAPLTGGIGLVAGAGVGLLAGDLLENWLADDNPCKTTMSRGAPVYRDDPEWLKLPIEDLINGLMTQNEN